MKVNFFRRQKHQKIFMKFMMMYFLMFPKFLLLSLKAPNVGLNLNCFPTPKLKRKDSTVMKTKKYFLNAKIFLKIPKDTLTLRVLCILAAKYHWPKVCWQSCNLLCVSDYLEPRVKDCSN
eukprot:Pompholyxophrys_punicea_v1_NODE_260_length_2503_cov_15.998366.p5 type:complete len:120 gc:universal NODE_260_length_2503_cov_15.998366:1243-1602(+)